MHPEEDWVPIEYRDFYDAPRLFWVALPEAALVFDGAFSEALDDYPQDYQVYVVPLDALPQRGEPWDPGQHLQPVARVPAGEIQFDETRRKAIRRELVDRLAKRL